MHRVQGALTLVISDAEAAERQRTQAAARNEAQTYGHEYADMLWKRTMVGRWGTYGPMFNAAAWDFATQRTYEVGVAAAQMYPDDERAREDFTNEYVTYMAAVQQRAAALEEYGRTLERDANPVMADLEREERDGRTQAWSLGETHAVEWVPQMLRDIEGAKSPAREARARLATALDSADLAAAARTACPDDEYRQENFVAAFEFRCKELINEAYPMWLLTRSSRPLTEEIAEPGRAKYRCDPDSIEVVPSAWSDPTITAAAVGAAAALLGSVVTAVVTPIIAGRLSRRTERDTAYRDAMIHLQAIERTLRYAVNHYANLYDYDNGKAADLASPDDLTARLRLFAPRRVSRAWERMLRACEGLMFEVYESGGNVNEEFSEDDEVIKTLRRAVRRFRVSLRWTWWLGL